MRILLDECVPRPLRRALVHHEVRTVVEMGWAGKRNGELLQLLRTETCAVFLTTDQNLRYQQNLRGLRYHWYEHPGTGRAEPQRKRVHAV